ncbi:MAG TPA: SDR family NAD(P)-dependent oxidoreductase [Tepidisphaeraceae bacterium]|jgi:NAD(P)-dependent dehydrogenase (short-subunit alcohol dehydrogenase family)
MQLQNKVAVVTGGGSGIGKAAAVAFAQAGAKVGVLGHTGDDVYKAVAEINAAGGESIPLIANISDATAIKAAYATTVEKFGKLDIVFANAGINGVWAPIEDIADEEWEQTISNNLTGTFITIKYAVPYLKQNGGGSILVTASINGTRVFSNTGATAYSTSKAGQVAMTKMLALELAPSKIRVNVICPGAIKTNIGQNTEARDVEKVKIEANYSRPHPLRDAPGTSEQVAQLALFLASDASSHITGTPIWIDGAESLLRG